MGKAQEQGIVTRLAKDIGLQPPPKQFWLHSPVSCLGGCHPEQVAELRALLEPYDVVGVQTFHGLFVASQLLAGPLGWECGNNACCQSFEKATLALRKAPQVGHTDGALRRRAGRKLVVEVQVKLLACRGLRRYGAFALHSLRMYRYPTGADYLGPNLLVPYSQRTTCR